MSLNGHARSMIVTLNTQSLSWLAEVRAFLDGAAEVELSAPPSADRHAWLAATLRQFHYGTLRRPDKSLVRAFVLKVTGYSRAQLTRLIRQWQQDGSIADRRGPPTQPFARRYTEADVRALVTLDRLHGQLSGPATRKLAERAFNVFGHRREPGDVLARHVELDRAVGERAQRLDLGAQLGQAEVHDLVVEDGLAEGLALAGVLDRLVDRQVQAADPAGRGPQPLLLELHHLEHEAHAFLADQVAPRHAHAVEEQLRGVRRVHPDLVDLLLRDPGRVHRHDDQALVLVRRALVAGVGGISGNFV